jgi:hypothetical protein
MNILKMGWLLLLILTGSSSLGQLSIAQRAEFRITLRAVDDEGRPVPRANLGFSWGHLGDTSPDTAFKRVDADEQGLAVFNAQTRFFEYAYGAGKDGYYPTRGIAGRFQDVTDGRWQPWNQTVDVVIRPIKNPVPMYAKHVACSLPAMSTWLGYDLQKGDWLPPHGHGEQADLEFHYEGHVENNINYDGKLSLRFPGMGNGIQAFEQDRTMHSEFRMPYEAPVDGYARSWAWRNARITEKKPGAISTFIDERFLGRNFIFRVRSVLDPEGKVIRAWYGKIHSPFLLDPRGDNGCGYIQFTYYCNPDETRNLEFDPRRNLFSAQDVKAP